MKWSAALEPPEGESEFSLRLSSYLASVARGWDTLLRKRGGKEAARFELATAGAPQRVEPATDKLSLRANGTELAYVEIRVVGAGGRRVYRADSTIEVQAIGAGKLAAMASGDPADAIPVQ